VTDINLTQSEADALIAMKKYRINENAKALEPVFKARMFAEVQA
jgi:hypothetical protein